MSREVSMQEVAERLSSLEKDNARLRRTVKRFYLVGGSLLAVIVLTGAMLRPDPTKFEKAIEIYDGNNTMRVALYADNGNGECGLELFDSNGRNRFTLLCEKKTGNPFMFFREPNGKVRLGTGITDRGKSALDLCDSNGNPKRGIQAVDP